MKKRELKEEQARIYAEELGKLYQEEQQLRKELEKEKQTLEYRVKELTGLNQMFQSFLNQHHELLNSSNALIESISDLYAQAQLFQQKIAQYKANREVGTPD